MPLEKLKNYLDKNNVQYQTITHSQAYTAQEVAASAHIPGKEVAKTVMVFVDGEMAMTVLPASYRIDLDLLKEVTGTKDVRIATESEFKASFPECETGTMPPFGNLYNMRAFVAQSLTEDEDIAFNAGSHTEMIKMSYSDYVKLAEPVVLSFTHPEA